MTVFRVEKNKNYTVMSNCHLKDKNLRLKAKGLLSVMLSLPDDWDYTEMGLCAITGEGRDSIRSALKNLESAGYLARSKKRDESGKIVGTEYIIYERPMNDMDSPLSGFPTLVNPTLDKPTLANPTQLNTNNTNSLINKTNSCEPQPRATKEQLVELWNSSSSVVKIKGIVPGSDRDKNVNKLFSHYSIDEIKTAVSKIDKSSYLRNKHAKFDWFVRNMDKILEGNYDEEYPRQESTQTKFADYHQRQYDYSKLEELLINKGSNSIANANENERRGQQGNSEH